MDERENVNSPVDNPDEDKELAKAERSFLKSQRPRHYKPRKPKCGILLKSGNVGNWGNPDWAKGKSGNPGGRPRMALFSKAVRARLGELIPGDPDGCTFAERLARNLINRAIYGDELYKCDVTAAREVLDRAEGKAQQYIEIQQTVLQAAYNKMSMAELEAYAASGTLPDWWPRDAKDSSETIQ